MHDLAVLFVHLITTALRIAQPGGLRSVIAESVLIKHQLLIVNRSRRRAPNLRIWDRLIAGLVLPVDPASPSLAISNRIQPSTLLNFHRELSKNSIMLGFEEDSSLRGSLPECKTLPATVFDVL